MDSITTIFPLVSLGNSFYNGPPPFKSRAFSKTRPIPMDGSKAWDHEKFAVSLRKEIDRRKVVRDLPISSGRSSNRLFDQFLMFGPTVNSDLALLAAYPAVQIFETTMAQFMDYCFPTGPSRANLRKCDKERIIDQFVFQLNYSTGVVYGICLHAQGAALLPYLKKKGSAKMAVALCLLTSVPAFSAHISFLTHLASVAMGNEPPAHQKWPEAPVFPGLKAVENLKIESLFGWEPSVTFAAGFGTEIAWYYHQPPGLQASLSAEDFGPMAEGADMGGAMWGALDTLFSVLMPKDILTSVACLLLDGQVLVLGDSLQEITMTVLGLICLIRPFEFAGTVVPIIPSTPGHLQLLNSPSPFLIGCVLTGALREFSFVDTALFIELDKHRVVFSGGQLPRFPGASQVTSGIHSLLSCRRNTEGGSPFGFPQQMHRRQGHKLAFPLRVAEQILAIVQAPLGQITSDLLVCFFVTDLSADDEGITVFNRELFIATVPASDQAFFNMLFDSMSFQLYVEKRIHDFEKERGKSQPERPIPVAATEKVEVAPPRKVPPGVLIRGRPRTKSISRMPSFTVDGPESD
jgi:hypothetical protein